MGRLQYCSKGEEGRRGRMCLPESHSKSGTLSSGFFKMIHVASRQPQWTLLSPSATRVRDDVVRKAEPLDSRRVPGCALSCSWLVGLQPGGGRAGAYCKLYLIQISSRMNHEA